MAINPASPFLLTSTMERFRAAYPVDIQTANPNAISEVSAKADVVVIAGTLNGSGNIVPLTSGGGGGGGSSLADNLVVDAAGVYWILQDQGGGTFVYYKLSTLAVGTPTAPVVPAATSTGLQIVDQSYDVITAGTGYAVGDILEHIVVLNIVTVPPTIITSAWINITQGTVLGAVPVAANIVITPTTQTITAVDGGLATIGTKADSAYTGSGSASAIALYKGLYNLLAAPIPAGGNAIGTVGVTGTVAVTQSGTWTTARSWNLASGSDSVSIGGTLPAFAAPPTFNLGTLNGAATAALQTSLITAIGAPMQQTGGTVALAAGTNTIGAVTIGQGSTAERTAASSITTGGTAQLVEAATATRIGFTIQNTSTGDLWFSTASTTPSAASPAFRLPAGQTYQTPENWSPTGAFYIYGATTGQTFTYRSW